MKITKKLLTVLISLIMCLELIPAIVSADPKKKTTVVARNDTVFLNTQDGKTQDEFNYNNVNSGNSGINWGYYGGSTNSKFLAMYLKFDINEFEGENVTEAKVYAGFGGTGTTFKMYGIPNEDWDDERAPIVVRTSANQIGDTVTKISPAVNDPALGEYNAVFDCSETVKKAIANGDTYVCFEIECTNSGAYSSIYGKAGTSPSYPKLEVETSTNNLPVISAETDKEDYEEGESITVTADATDEDGDSFTFSFKYDGVPDEENADGNVYTYPSLTSGDHRIDVICTDEWGDYSVYPINFTVKGSPVKTWNLVDCSGILNCYDGKDATEYNNSTMYSQPYNYVLSGDSAKPIQLYFKFDVSAYKDKNISEVCIPYWIQSSNHRGSKMNVYGLEPSDWSTTVGPVVDRTVGNILQNYVVPMSVLVNYEATDPKYSFAEGYNTIFGDTQAEVPSYGITDYVKSQIAKGQTTVCFVLERITAGYSTASKSLLPRLAIRTTTNNVPTVELSADKDIYENGDTMYVTALGNDSDNQEPLTYKFYIDGEEADASFVDGNVLNAGICDGTVHDVTVRCYDEWGDYGAASIKVGSDAVYEASGTLTGAVASGKKLTAKWNVKNKSDEKLNFRMVIAIYNPNGGLYHAEFFTDSIDARDEDSFTQTYTLTEEEEFNDCYAKAYLWQCKTFAPIGDILSCK